MAPQLTLQAPLELPPRRLRLPRRLWNGGEQDSTSSGAATFSLLVWQPSWIEQHLVRLGRLDGPITGPRAR